MAIRGDHHCGGKFRRLFADAPEGCGEALGKGHSVAFDRQIQVLIAHAEQEIAYESTDGIDQHASLIGTPGRRME
jgi:hypothetical protein